MEQRVPPSGNLSEVGDGRWAPDAGLRWGGHREAGARDAVERRNKLKHLTPRLLSCSGAGASGWKSPVRTS